MLTPIHNCLQANLENEYYKEKLTEFYKENKNLKEKLKELLNQNDHLMIKQAASSSKHPTSREIHTQTTAKQLTLVETNHSFCSVCERKQTNSSLSSSQKQSVTTDSDLFNKQNKKSYVKLCEMQHSLLKKYENEVNSNAVKQDLINHMKLELDSLESSKNKVEEENVELKKRLEMLEDLETKHKSLVLDYESCKLKCKKYKNELKCFDKRFFDELEELKKNYHDSIKLNKHYEDLLYQLNKKNLIASSRKMLKKEVKFAVDGEPNEDEEYEEENDCLKSMSSEFSQFLDDYGSKNTDDNDNSINIDKLMALNETKNNKESVSDPDETLDYQLLIDQLAAD